MKKWLAMLLVFALCAGTALAEPGAADVTMEGESYHLVLDSVDVVDGQLTVVMEGFGDTLRMGANGAMLAGMPEAHYGDEIVTVSTVNIVVGAPFTFTFDRDALPDEIWVKPYDDGAEPVLIWSAGETEGESADASDTTSAPDAETEDIDETDAQDSGATFSVPTVPTIVVPEVKVPDLPKVATPAAPKIVVPDIPKVQAPQVEIPTYSSVDPIDPEVDAIADAAVKEAIEGNAPAEEPEDEPTEEPAEELAGEIPVDEVLDALGEDAYRATYDALLAGEVVEKGGKGDTAKGVQQTLVALGQDIAMDGNVGPKSIAALNAAQAAFGLEESESLDAAGYAVLLPRLLTMTDPDGAEALLGDALGGEFDYMRACAFVAQEKYYSARQAFEESAWGDWADRAAACEQAWPKTGQLYKNPDVKGSATTLSVQFNSDEDTAMLVKVYTMDDVLARTLFIGGTGKASTSLPAGTYVIKDGTGTAWYGEEEAFGEAGYYEIMTFSDGEQQVELKKNYTSTITVNVQEANPDAEGVGSDWESWGEF